MATAPIGPIRLRGKSHETMASVSGFRRDAGKPGKSPGCAPTGSRQPGSPEDQQAIGRGKENIPAVGSSESDVGGGAAGEHTPEEFALRADDEQTTRTGGPDISLGIDF
jgi:hypothetical protein